jgi:hypothetical protein
MNNIEEFINDLSNILNIDKNKLLSIVDFNKLKENKFEPDIINKINKLKTIDNQIIKYEDKILNLNVKNNFKSLKINLAKLQLLSLFKLFEKNNLLNNIHNHLSASNSKLSIIENIMKEHINNKYYVNNYYNINNIYYHKYLKYKIKYIKFKIKYNII